jgi:hypothetical protein
MGERERPRRDREAPKFPLTAWEDINFDIDEEWRVEGVLPLVGLVVLFGGPSSLKTFVLLDIFLRALRAAAFGGDVRLDNARLFTLLRKARTESKSASWE